MKKAALINASGKYSKIILSILVNAILARILSADDYGIVAIITVFSTFFTTFSDMGFGAAIIQKKELKRDDINDIYSFTVYVSLILMVVFALLSYPIAAFYHNDVYIRLGQLLSISLLFNSLNMVPNGILNREKRFRSIAVRTVVVYVGSAIVTIILAFQGLRYYALVIQAILTAVLTFAWNFWTTHPKFKFSFNMSSIKSVMNYSGYQFAFNIVNYFSRNLDNLLTGKLLGSAELGYYNKAYTLMLYPVNNLAGVVSPVLHPLLSDYQKHKEIIYKKYIKIFRLIAIAGIYIAAICYLSSGEIIRIMYGKNWDAAIICFRYLSIAIIPQMLNAIAGGIFQALGNTKLLFMNSTINTVITVIAILVGVLSGKTITALSLAVGIAYICHFLTTFYMLIKMGFRFQMINTIRLLRREMVLLIVMIAAVLFYPFSINAFFISLMVKCIYLGIIYLIAMIITGDFSFGKHLLFK